MLLFLTSHSKGAPGPVLEVKAFAGLLVCVGFFPRFERAKHVWAAKQMLEEGTNENHLEVTLSGRVCAPSTETTELIY